MTDDCDAENHATLIWPRRLIWEKLQNCGNYAHNTSVIKAGKGYIIPYRRPATSSNVRNSDYVPCEVCLAFFVKTVLWKHIKSCRQQKGLSTSASVRPDQHQRESAALLPLEESVSGVFKASIVDGMAHDKISFIVN